MDDLREGLVAAREQDQDLGRGGTKCLGCHAEERALLVDRVDDDPVQGQKEDLGAVERELVEAAYSARGRVLQPAQADRRRHFAQLGAAFVGDTKHEGRAAAEGRHDRRAAEDDARSGTGEAREEQPRRQRETQEADERLDRYQKVDERAVRGHAPVADRRERLHAEEEGILVAGEARSRVPAIERVRAAQVVEEGEQQVRGEVAARDQQKEARPRRREQRVVDRERAVERQPFADHIEAAVAVEQPSRAVLRDAAAEAEILSRVFARCAGALGFRRPCRHAPPTAAAAPSSSVRQASHRARGPSRLRRPPSSRRPRGSARP